MSKLIPLDNSNAPAYVAADYIAEKLLANNSVDHSNLLFFLPTRASVRLVRNRVLKKMAKRGRDVVFGLQITTPEMFFSEISQAEREGNSFQEIAAWVSALSANADLHNLFTSVNPDASSRVQIAFEFALLRNALTKAGENLQTAAKIFSSSEDADRWSDISKLEGSYLKNMEAFGVLPSESLPVDAVRDAAWLNVYQNIKQIFVVGIPDASNLFLLALDKMEKLGAGVEYAVFADAEICREGLENFFDEHGVPLKSWSEKALPLSDSAIYVVDSLKAQASICANAVEKYGEDRNLKVAVVCNESDSQPIMMDALSARGIDAYSPEGVSMASLSVGRFLKSLLAVCRGGGIREYITILKNPFVLDYVRTTTALDTEKIISDVEKFMLRHLPKDLKNALSMRNPYGESDNILRVLNGLIFDDKAQSPLSRLSEILRKLFFSANDSVWSFDGEREFVLDFFAEQISQMNFDGADSLLFEDLLVILLKNAESAKHMENKAQNALPLLDWIEGFWSPQAHIIINDFNGGILPSLPTKTQFLPDSAAAKVGLKTSEMRRARDAYMLYTLLRSRGKNGGIVSCIVPRMRENGDVASASVLLLQCDNENLPKRVKQLFDTPNGVEPLPKDKPSWKLKIPFRELPKSLPATAFKSYLTCPFRFYLSYVLGMKMNDYTREELDAASVGTFIHRMWEKFANSECADSKDPADIEKALAVFFEETRKETIGDFVSGAISIQLDSIKKSLPSYAKIQAERRAAGWKIKEKSELSISGYRIGNFDIRMKIDRVDENENGDICIVDYKTYDSIRKRKNMSVPEAFHKTAKRNPLGGNTIAWSDLQLPLYVDAYTKKFAPKGKVICAYCILSKDESVSGFYDWDINDVVRECEDLNATEPDIATPRKPRSMLDSALDEALRVTECISARKFEPNEEFSSPYDSYSKFFSFMEGKIKDYIEWEGKK